MSNKQVQYTVSPYLGCDPELFITSEKGDIVGSEKAVPAVGVGSIGGKIVQDGVQVEFNITADTCRARLGNKMAATFKTLKAHLDKTGGLQASFSSVVEVSKAELDSLSEKSKTLGCAPSFNKYDEKASISVDPATYTKRSAGGHLHIGLTSYPTLMKYREEMVPVLDCLVGNTSVLIDRDPHAAERRKVYGRAGEYRLPNHGLEYRTLSNFWLRAYPLMHGMMGLCRLAVNVLAQGHCVESTKQSNSYLLSKEYQGTHQATYDKLVAASAEKEWDATGTLLSMVDIEKVTRAINENDLNLAKENWVGIRKFIANHVPCYDWGLNQENVNAFDYFIRKIDEKGIEYWFPQDPMTYWTKTFYEGHSTGGWETFMNCKVAPDMTKGRMANVAGTQL